MYQTRTALFAMLLPLAVAGCGGNSEIAPASDLLPVSCLAKPDTGSCRAARPAFQYDYATDTCRSFLYGGCGAPPFATMEDCLRTCGGRPSP